MTTARAPGPAAARHDGEIESAGKDSFSGLGPVEAWVAPCWLEGLTFSPRKPERGQPLLQRRTKLASRISAAREEAPV
jgi:hypothetical protein